VSRDTRRSTPRARVFFDIRGTERVYIARPGPLGLILVILVTAILSAVLLVLLSAVFLIAMPVVVLLVTAVLIAEVGTGVILAPVPSPVPARRKTKLPFAVAVPPLPAGNKCCAD
jgi:hypothetical protein